MKPGQQQIDSRYGKEEPPSILIVDDERVICELCARVLGDYRVTMAGNCDEALQIYELERNDLVLADVMMPGGDGIQLLRRIKEMDPHATVIIMTGFAEKEIILKALKEDADDFISKPLNFLQLKTAVTKALGRKQLKEELASLKKLDRLKSNFLSLISHKLRTPITAISLFMQNIQRGVHDPQDEFFIQNVKLINDEAAYLGRMVNDLLVFSKAMEGGKELQLEPCNLNMLLLGALQSSQEAVRKPRVTLEFHEVELPIMKLDRSKLTFAFLQIIDNAFKFSNDTGQVVINARVENESVVVKVSDSGVGIPGDEIQKVVEKFYQVDPDNTGQVRGFGLGLFYAREFIQLHGGKLTIVSLLDQGTTVTVRLPLQSI